MDKESIIVDAQYQPSEVIKQNPDNPCPAEILDSLGLLDVKYIGFDGKLHRGQIVVAIHVMSEVEAFFKRALELEFPIEKVIPAADPRYGWDDQKMMADNNTSGFNYRAVAGTKRTSQHGKGMAIDVNTRLNPCIRYDKQKKLTNPPGSVWRKQVPGTLHSSHPLVLLMEGFGWHWGGNWTLEKEGIVDYQHFQKPRWRSVY